MRQSIFDIENRIDKSKEFKKIIDVIFEYGTLTYNYTSYSFINFVDNYIFPIWPYRDTFLDCREYLEHIGVTEYCIKNEVVFDIPFINLIEFLLNMNWYIDNEFRNRDQIEWRSNKLISILDRNLELILEKVNYKSEVIEDRVIVVKRDADVDSVLNLVSSPIADVILSYNDRRNQNNIEIKKSILKELDLFIEKSKKKYQGYDKQLYDSIQTIVNEMGINHPIKNEPYINFEQSELIAWYDKCFLMMLHIIRYEDINEIKKERLYLVKNVRED